ncbi:MAG: hypothetical protein HYV65_02050 [Candidatus Spechtbacteria bacterium]|nr:hypothetical protein [Candidatus Spechtbacteria bacterium]
MDASDEQASKKPKTSKHHFRPRSRGGNNEPDNLVAIAARELHDPYHALFTNLRPHEVFILLYFCWDTISIAANTQVRHSNDISSWTVLFGRDATSASARKSLWEGFVSPRKNDEDLELMEHADKLCKYAKNAGILGINGIYLFDKEEYRLWEHHSDYTRIFGRLLPHEAILVAFLAWHTFCPYRERESQNTFFDSKTGKPAVPQFRKRIETWMWMFSDGDPQRVIDLIESKYTDPRDKSMRDLASQAKKICIKMRNSGLLRH